MAEVTLKSVVKKYGTTEVIHGIDLDIADGEFCVFVGPSGCGKSTLLRMVAGLEETTDGAIHIGERDVTHTDPSERGIAMVFQTYALYPHMTVQENMGFGLKMNGVPKDEIDRKVGDASAVLQLDEYLSRKPAALSGGQRQRVAIGRAIVRGPDVFLFDEPLSNLDAELRVDMRVEISRLHKELGTTMIYVTHDQVEAMTLADKIVVLRAGNIEQVGSPMELYKNPDNKFVAGFIGSPGMNFLKAKVKNGGISIPAFEDKVYETNIKLPKDGTEITVGLRPQVFQPKPGKGKMVLELSERLGGVTYHYVTTPSGERIIVESNDENELAKSDNLTLEFDASNMMAFDAKTEARIR